MNIVQIAAIIILTIFYASYFTKMVLLKRQGINSNLLGKGDKPTKTLWVERLLKIVTFSG